jgi:hypothetical protein
MNSIPVLERVSDIRSYSIIEDDYSSQRIARAAELYESPPCSLPRSYLTVPSDVELSFDDKVMPGHSQLLSLWSKVLKEAIETGSSQGASAVTKETHQLSIPMNGTSSIDWLKVVPFIYPPHGGEATVTWHNVKALLVLGDKYDMPGLACKALKFLDTHQAEMNAIDKDHKYIWKWILLLDHTAASNQSLVLKACIKRAASGSLKNTCTRENMKGLSRDAVEMLAAALAGTSLLPISHLTSLGC